MFKHILIIFIWSVLSFNLFCQSPNDIELIKKRTFEKPEYNERIVRFGFSDKSNKFVRYNPVTLTFGGLMYFYQKWVSPQFSSTCLYKPSCSSYSKQLIKEFGLVKGIVCSSDRLMRCNKLAGMNLSVHDIDDHTHKVHESTDYYRKRKKENGK